MRKVWTLAEEKFILDNYKDMTDEEMAARLDRTTLAVRNRRLSLDCIRKGVYEVYKGYELLAQGSKEEVLKQLGIAEGTLYCYLSASHSKRSIGENVRYAIRVK